MPAFRGSEEAACRVNSRCTETFVACGRSEYREGITGNNVVVPGVSRGFNTRADDCGDLLEHGSSDVLVNGLWD